MTNQPYISVVIYCNNNNINNSDKIEESFYSVLNQDYQNKEIIIIDNSSSNSFWEDVCTLLNTPQSITDFVTSTNINNVDCSAIKHEFKTNITGVLISGINSICSNTDIIGLLDINDKYLPGKLSHSIDYTSDILDKVGIIYSDYEIVTSKNKNPVKIYQQSFSRNNITSEFGDTALITKHAIKPLGIIDPEDKNDSLVNFYTRITKQFVAIHIPEILHVKSRS